MESCLGKEKKMSHISMYLERIFKIKSLQITGNAFIIPCFKILSIKPRIFKSLHYFVLFLNQFYMLVFILQIDEHSWEVFSIERPETDKPNAIVVICQRYRSNALKYSRKQQDSSTYNNS